MKLAVLAGSAPLLLLSMGVQAQIRNGDLPCSSNPRACLGDPIEEPSAPPERNSGGAGFDPVRFFVQGERGQDAMDPIQIRVSGRTVFLHRHEIWNPHGEPGTTVWQSVFSKSYSVSHDTSLGCKRIEQVKNRQGTSYEIFCDNNEHLYLLTEIQDAERQKGRRFRDNPDSLSPGYSWAVIPTEPGQLYRNDLWESALSCHGTSVVDTGSAEPLTVYYWLLLRLDTPEHRRRGVKTLEANHLVPPGEGAIARRWYTHIPRKDLKRRLGFDVLGEPIWYAVRVEMHGHFDPASLRKNIDDYRTLEWYGYLCYGRGCVDAEESWVSLGLVSWGVAEHQEPGEPLTYYRYWWATDVVEEPVGGSSLSREMCTADSSSSG